MMITKFKITIIIIIVLPILGTGNLSGQDWSENSFASALLYISHEKEIINKVRSMFPKIVNKRQKCLDMSVSARIEYCPIYNFFSSYLDKSLLDSITNRNETVPPEEYDKINKFESFNLPYLTRLLPESNTDLIIRFSRPHSGYILAEILDKRLNFGKFRYGKSVQILLVFGEHLEVKQHYLTTRLYN